MRIYKNQILKLEKESKWRWRMYQTSSDKDKIWLQRDSNVKTSKKGNLKTIGFSSEGKLDRKQDAKTTTRKQNKKRIYV